MSKLVSKGWYHLKWSLIRLWPFIAFFVFTLELYLGVHYYLEILAKHSITYTRNVEEIVTVNVV